MPGTVESQQQDKFQRKRLSPRPFPQEEQGPPQRSHLQVEEEDEDGEEEEEEEEGGEDDLEDEDEEVQVSKCSRCLSGFRKVLMFLLSHIGLISLVVGYCIVGAFTFEALEKNNEIRVKKNMSQVREAVSKHLWKMTRDSEVIRPDEWHLNATKRLQEFEGELLRAMKKGGWNGSEDPNTCQWTFAGALFYSIVVITTIGYGHLTTHTVAGKVVTIFYAIMGIPLMLLCLSHIGDFLAKAFRFLYWKVCCYMCYRKPKRIKRPPPGFYRGRSLRFSGSSRYSGSTRGGPPPGGMGAMRRSIRRSARTSQRSADSAMSDSAISACSDPVMRRARSDEDLFRGHGAHSIRGRPPPLPSTLPRQISKTSSKSTPRSRSSEPPVVGNNLKNLPPVLFNKYAEELPLPPSEIMPITKESEIKRGRPGSDRFRHPLSHPDQFIMEEYWEEDEYYSDEQEMHGKKRPVPIWLCIMLVFGYIIFGAFLFSNWENWEFLDSAYFCFITLTTIGFGDFVPNQKQRLDREPEISIALCSLYLLFGISLLAMSFNLVQEEVISNVKELAMKLGIIREEEQ